MQMDRIEGEIESVQGENTYRLRFDFNVIADFEESTGRQIFAALQNLGAPDTRLIVHLCLRDAHCNLTLRDAGRIVSRDIGLITRLLAATFPAAAGNGDDDLEKLRAAAPAA